jgi:hypothetical protein
MALEMTLKWLTHLILRTHCTITVISSEFSLTVDFIIQLW